MTNLITTFAPKGQWGLPEQVGKLDDGPHFPGIKPLTTEGWAEDIITINQIASAILPIVGICNIS